MSTQRLGEWSSDNPQLQPVADDVNLIVRAVNGLELYVAGEDYSQSGQAGGAIVGRVVEHPDVRRWVVTDRVTDNTTSTPAARFDLVWAQCTQYGPDTDIADTQVIWTPRVLDIGEIIYASTVSNQAAGSWAPTYSTGATVQQYASWALVGGGMNVGVISATGPNGEAAPTGNSYWVQVQSVQTSGALANMAQGTPAKPVIVKVANVLEAAASHSLAVGRQVTFGPLQSLTAAPHFPQTAGYAMITAGQPPIFPVTLTQSGGSNGSQTSAATYTYIVKSISGTTLGTTGTTPIQPTWARDFGSVNTATHGTAYYDDSGNLVLYQADETPTTRGC